MLWAALLRWVYAFWKIYLPIPIAAFTEDTLNPVDSKDNPSYITLQLKRNKNYPFGAGVTLHLGATGSPICLVASMFRRLHGGPCPGIVYIRIHVSTVFRR